jgi:hypothetical protein
VHLLTRAPHLEEPHFESIVHMADGPSISSEQRPLVAAKMACLRYLSSQDELDTAAKLPRIPPNPRSRFMLDFAYMSEASKLDVSTRPLYVQLLARVQTFWRTAAPEERLPQGVITMKAGALETTHSSRLAGDHMASAPVHCRSTCGLSPVPAHDGLEDVTH